MFQLLPSQQRFVDDPARVKLLVGLRGAGKTTAALAALLKVAEPGKLYGACWILARYQVGNLTWICEGVLKEVSEIRREIVLINGAKVLWFSPSEQERLRSRIVSGLMLDDADLYPEGALYDFMQLTPGPVIVTSSHMLSIEGASVTELVSFIE